MTTRRFFRSFLLIAALLVLLGGCELPVSNSPSAKTPAAVPPVTTPEPNPTPAPMKEVFSQTSDPVTGETIALIQTSKGRIKMKFFPQYAPETVKNFLELSKKGFYDGILFHRVIPGFMIQGGDPSGNGTGGESYKGPGTTVKGEVKKELKHVHGAVSMANRGGDPSSATSQFFIVQNAKGADFLDGGYTIFGQVVEGLDVVDAIANSPRDPSDKPKVDIKMEKVEITTQE